MTIMTVRSARPSDRREITRMRRALWPDSTEGEVDKLLRESREGSVVLVVEGPGGGLIGFAELGIRKFADGCLTSPVAYLEGVWSDPEHRRSGVASALLDEGVIWAPSQGLSELASDCEIDNAAGEAFHLATGFKEVQRTINFRRDLTSESS